MGRLRWFPLGLVPGLLVGLGLAFLATRDARDEGSWALVPVLVTSRELPAGHRLEPADLVESGWPRALVTESCATPENRSRFTGRTVRWRVAEATVLREGDLVPADPACAARVRQVLESLDGGAPEVAALGAALLERHEGTP